MADERREGGDEVAGVNGEGGRQVGGGPNPSDQAAPGGSSGGGGYGNAQNQQFHQGQQEGSTSAGRESLSRGERFDEDQGGGRSADQVSSGEAEFAADQAEHQDRGQSVAEQETEEG